MKSEKYSLSFTACTLALNHSLILAQKYIQLKDWSIVRDEVISKNLLQANKKSTIIRYYAELSKRLKMLNDNELALLLNSSSQDQRYMLWLAICRSYKIVKDFAIEIIREKYINMQPFLNPTDFDSFLNNKADWHEEISDLKDSTKKKISQVLTKILIEIGLVTTDGRINPVVISPKMLKLIKENQTEELLIFPLVTEI